MPEIDWNSENLRILCKLLAEQVEKGNRPNTCLNSVGYDAVIKGLKDITGIDATKLQIKNKWDKLKEDYKAWKKLRRHQTGTGWKNGTVAMDDEWWKKAKTDIPGCGKFRKQPLQNEDELAICFGDIINIGIDHWSPCGANLQTPQVLDDSPEEALGVGDEEQDLVDAQAQEDNVETPTSGKRTARPVVEEKNKKVKTGNAVLIQEGVTSIASSANEYISMRQGKFTIEQVMKHVIACGADYGTDEHYIASELFVKKEQREMWMTMPTDEIRFNWLKRKYAEKHSK